MSKFTADFETTTDPNDCRVWAYGICEIDNPDNFIYGNNIKDFLIWCENSKNATLYFHNLKFDIEFILSELFKQGYKHDKNKNENTFNTVISSLGTVYQLEIIFKKLNKKYRKVTIYDSYKKLPFSVDRIAKAFDLPISKLELDYKKKRPINHKLTPHEIEYLKNDVEIMARALKIQFNQGLTKITIGSDAMHDYKETIGTTEFKATFPVFDIEKDDDLRSAYRGGFTYLNPKHKEKMIGEGLCYDVNSLYPHCMASKLLPIGRGIYFDGQYEYDERYPLYIQKITTKFKVKKDHIPTIQIKKNLAFNPVAYIEEVEEEVTLRLTNVDLQLFLDHYDIIYIEYECGWKFTGAYNLFSDYINKWAEIKMNNTGAIRELAKLMLNNLYGKFGTNPDCTQKIPFMDDDNMVKYKLDDKEIREPVYVPMASFITSYAREITIRTAQSLYDRFIYADTDSLHLIGTEIPNIDIDDKLFGYWKLEYKFDKAKFLKPKTYIEEVEGKLVVKCAGMTENIRKDVNFDNFNIGTVFEGKLRQTKVIGGVVLSETEFRIR